MSHTPTHKICITKTTQNDPVDISEIRKWGPTPKEMDTCVHKIEIFVPLKNWLAREPLQRSRISRTHTQGPWPYRY